VYQTVILPIVLYGCESWSLRVMEESRVRVVKNRMLRNIFGPKRDEVTGEWGRPYNEEFYGNRQRILSATSSQED